VFLFEKLAVYQRGLAFAERCSSLTEGFARGHWYLADQLNRASPPISLNIAELMRRRARPKDRRGAG
jgi:four helix bundle protein